MNIELLSGIFNCSVSPIKNNINKSVHDRTDRRANQAGEVAVDECSAENLRATYRCLSFVFGALFIFVMTGTSAALAAGYVQESGGQGIVSMEAENAHGNVSQSGISWVDVASPPAGFSGTGVMLASPDNGVKFQTNYAVNSPRLDFQVEFNSTGTHYVWIRGVGPNGGSNSVHVGLDGQEIASSDNINIPAKAGYAWSGRYSLVVNSVGQHTINVWMREDGTELDKVVLTTDPSLTPSGTNPPESSQSGGTPTVATPTFSPNGGSHVDSVVVILDTTTAGAELYYTTDGTTPTSGSTPYADTPFTLTSSATVKVLGALTGYNDSVIASVSFTIASNVAPELDPIGDYMVTEGQNLTFTVTATDDLPPVLSADLSNLPAGATFIPSTGVFNWTPSVGDATGSPYSAVFTATDASNSSLQDTETISITVNADSGSGTGPFQQESGGQGIVSIETENFHGNTAQGAHSWLEVSSPSGYSGSGAMRAMPDIGSNIKTGYGTTSPRLDFQVEFSHTGVHTIWLRGEGTGSSNSLHVGLNGQESGSQTIGFAAFVGYTWASGSINIPSAGVHTISVWMREDGTRLDKLELSASGSGYAPSGAGSPQSPQGGSSPSTVATPTFSPNGGSHVDSVVVTLDTTTGGAELYYTTDGTTPTSGSTPYADTPFTLTSSATVKVLGVLADYNDSVIASASFTIANNVAPELDPIGDRMVTEGQNLNFTATATDDLPPILSADLSDLPVGATFIPSTGVFNWTPSVGDAAGSPYSAVFTATDASNSSLQDTETISITVNADSGSGGGGTGPFLQSAGGQGIVSMEAESFHDNTAQGLHSWLEVSSPSGYSGTGAMRAMPDIRSNIQTGFGTTSPRLDFQVEFNQSGQHQIWVRGEGTGSSNSVHVGLNGQESGSQAIHFAAFAGYAWASGSINIPSAGVHTISVWMREDGTRLDKLELSPSGSGYVPNGTGSPQSAQGSLCDTFPSVAITSPEVRHLQTSTSLTVETLTCLTAGVHDGWGAKIRLRLLDDATGLPGVQVGVDKFVYSEPFEVTFNGLDLDEYVVQAFLVGGGAPGNIQDQVLPVGLGAYFVTVGDSITLGTKDSLSPGDPNDDTSDDGRDSGGGFQPVLNNLLTADRGYPHTIKNEGVPGDHSSDGLARLPSVIAAHPMAQVYLLKFGMNDANPNQVGGALPSGQGLTIGDADYPGTFKDNLQQMITLINDIPGADKEIVLAKVNIALGDGSTGEKYLDPDAGARSMRIKEYNDVVDELIALPGNAISKAPADFYGVFFNTALYLTHYYDNIHPNGPGYATMADEWSSVLLAP